MKEYFNKIFNGSQNNFYKLIENNLKNNEKTFVVTANPETIMIAEENCDFKKCLLDNKTMIIADGIGIVKGANMLGYPLKERIPGVELAVKLLEYCNTYKKSICLFGSTDDVITKMNNIIKERFPDATLVGSFNGYIEDKEKVFNEIVNLKPDVTLVALGIPKQELLIYNHLDFFEKGIFVGVGGSFDVISGSKKRAPKLFIKLHLEWLYRILKEPKRIKRFFNSNIKYLLKIKKEK